MFYLLEITIFICGAGVMILELVGSRILAPYFGASLVVWTSLIGIILGALSLGYYFGGRAADNNATNKRLSFIIFLSALYIGLVVLTEAGVLSFLQKNIKDLYLGSVLASFYLFFIPSVLLGMVTPYAVKLKLNVLTASGKTVGNLYAISTIGSIVGTFSAGFVLIPKIGSHNLLFVITIMLIVASVLIWPQKKIFKTSVIFLFLVFAIFNFGKNKDVVADIDTEYSRVIIKDIIKQSPLKSKRVLVTDPFGTQSAIYLDSDDLVSSYLKFFRVAPHFVPNIKNSLMIGGAAYTYPQDFLKNNQEAQMDVVEIDPGMTAIAKKYFHLEDDPRLNIIHEDARTFLNRNQKKYDAIIVDAFGSGLSIPFQLTTKETIQKMYDSLNENGIVMTNVISSIEGQKGKFFRAIYRTYKEIFPNVYFFPIFYLDKNEEIQNIVILSFKSKEKPSFVSSDATVQSFLNRLWTKDIDLDMPILTDDYAPVDYYLIKSFY